MRRHACAHSCLACITAFRSTPSSESRRELRATPGTPPGLLRSQDGSRAAQPIWTSCTRCSRMRRSRASRSWDRTRSEVQWGCPRRRSCGSSTAPRSRRRPSRRCRCSRCTVAMAGGCAAAVPLCARRSSTCAPRCRATPSSAGPSACARSRRRAKAWTRLPSSHASARAKAGARAAGRAPTRLRPQRTSAGPRAASSGCVPAPRSRKGVPATHRRPPRVPPPTAAWAPAPFAARRCGDAGPRRRRPTGPAAWAEALSASCSAAADRRRPAPARVPHLPSTQP